MSGYTKRVRNLAVSVYDLIPHHSEQLEMFSSKSHAVAEAMDKINDKYGEFVITPALMMAWMTRSLTGSPLAGSRNWKSYICVIDRDGFNLN
jgi:hypothetical protein